MLLNDYKKELIPLRERLLKYTRKNPIGFRDLAITLDINPTTLVRFMSGKPIHYETFCKIDKYLDGYGKELP